MSKNNEYQKNVLGQLGGLDLVGMTGKEDYVVNARGGKVYKDLSKHKHLTITPDGNTYKVLSAGINQWDGNHQAIVTTQEGKEAIVYLIPNDYISWIDELRANSVMGVKLLPANVVFSNKNGKYTAKKA